MDAPLSIMGQTVTSPSYQTITILSLTKQSNEYVTLTYVIAVESGLNGIPCT
uniref:Uncharacterized protein n=1 Tax=Anguilla anguilla TaxID=7936 RepID=A0A0E9S2H5_ANGAN